MESQDNSIINSLSLGRIETISYDSPASASSPFTTGVPGLAKSTEVSKIRRYRGHAWQSEDTAYLTHH